MAKPDTKYRYSGPLSGVTLDDGREVMLHSGMEIQLPTGNGYVKTLVAQGFLTEVQTEEITPNPPLSKGGVKNKEATDNAS